MTMLLVNLCRSKTNYMWNISILTVFTLAHLPKVWYKQNWIWIGENYERICLKKKKKKSKFAFRASTCRWKKWRQRLYLHSRICCFKSSSIKVKGSYRVWYLKNTVNTYRVWYLKNTVNTKSKAVTESGI
jgi:hypothetical protein